MRKVAASIKVRASFCCYDNSNVIATLIITKFHLYLTQLWWQFFQMFVYGDAVYAQTRQVLTLKNRIEPLSYASTAYVAASYGLECAAGTLEPLAYTTASSAEFCYPIFLYRVNSLKTIPFTAARTYIAHIWKYPLPAPSFRVKPHYFWRFFSGTSKFSKHPRIGSDVFEVWCTY